MSILLAVLASAMVCYPEPPQTQNIENVNKVPTAIIMSCYGETIYPIPPCFDPGCPHPRPRSMATGCSTTGGLRPDPASVCLRIDDEPGPGSAFMFCVKGGESVTGALDPNQPCGSDIRVAP